MTTTTTISTGYKSDVGRRRQVNEDSCAVLNRAALNGRLDALLIVADGLGGRRAGEVASSLLVDTISFGVLETMSSDTKRATGKDDIERLLRDTIVRANGIIMTQGRFNRREETRGMATTCVAAIVHNGMLSIANVGDSRIYLSRGGELEQLTMDHSEVFEEIAKGRLTQEEARTSQFRNQITRAVGLELNVKPDITTHQLREGDTVLLCSDGLTTEIRDDVISDVLCTAPSAQDACDRLVSLALRNGGRDNITVVALRFGEFVPFGEFEDDLLAGDEPDTDPIQNWHDDTDALRDDAWDPVTSRAEQPSLVPDLEQMPPNRVRLPQPGTPAAFISQNAFAIIAFLVLAILVEGAMVYNVAHRTISLPPPIVSDQHQSTPAAPSFSYEPLKQVMSVPIQPGYLQLSSKGNPIVVTLDGTVQTYIVNEKKLLPMQGLTPTLEPVSKESLKGMHSRPDFYYDSAGNSYFIDPQKRCIQTYTAVGTRTNEDLGAGQLKAPTRLIVDPAGSIYVIDEGRLKVLSARPAQGTAAHPANADF